MLVERSNGCDWNGCCCSCTCFHKHLRCLSLSLRPADRTLLRWRLRWQPPCVLLRQSLRDALPLLASVIRSDACEAQRRLLLLLLLLHSCWECSVQSARKLHSHTPTAAAYEKRMKSN